MSQRIEVKPFGFSLTHEVPSTEQEYNALAPTRKDAMLEDAVLNIEYRGVFPEFRDALCSHLEKVTGVAREELDGSTEEKPVYESEGKYLARVVAEKYAGDKATFVAEHQAKAQEIIDGIKFDPSVKERSSDGPAIGKKDLAMAKELLERGEGMVAKVAAALAERLGRTVATDEKGLARAFADHRRAEAAKLEAATKASLGM